MKRESTSDGRWESEHRALFIVHKRRNDVDEQRVSSRPLLPTTCLRDDKAQISGVDWVIEHAAVASRVHYYCVPSTRLAAHHVVRTQCSSGYG